MQIQIQLTPQNKELIEQNKNAIEAFLNSAKFAEFAAQNPHCAEFPPLLDPILIQNQISAEIAWELNLPLKNAFSLLWVRNDGSGSAAFGSYLDICGVRRNNHDSATAFDGRAAYLAAFKDTQNYKNAFNCLSVSDYQTPSTRKFWALLPLNLPSICNVRDPISRIKTGINHASEYAPSINQKEFYLNEFNEILQNDLTQKQIENLEKILENRMFMPRFLISYKTSYKQWYKESLKPSLETIYSFISGGVRESILRLDLRLEILKKWGKIKSVKFIDMNEFSGGSGFDLFTKLASEFGFFAPKENAKQIFSSKSNKNGLDFALPAYLYIESSTLNNKAQIIIAAPQNANIFGFSALEEIKKENFEEVFNKAENELVFLGNESTKELLNKDKLLLKKVQIFCFCYAKSYLKNAEKLSSILLKEQDILDYLKQEKELKNELKTNINLGIAPIQNSRPEIIKNWEWYRKFLEI